MDRRRCSGGFSLVELVVALAVLAVLMVGTLGLLDSARRVARTETELVDVQENVRFAADHLLRVACMAGGSGLPLARPTSEGGAWGAVRLLSAAGQFVDDSGHARTALAGSDVLTLRGFFETSPFFVRAADVDFGARLVTVREDVAAGQDIELGADDLEGHGLLLLGQGRVAVAEVTGNDPPVGPVGARRVRIAFGPAGAPWSSLVADSALPGPESPFDVARVGVLDSYTYWVDPELRLMRSRSGQGGGEPLASGVGSLQVALGVDGDGDGWPETWYDQPTVAQVTSGAPIALRITVLGRTPQRVPGWVEPAATFAVEDLEIATVERGARWRRLQSVAVLRNRGQWEVGDE